MYYLARYLARCRIMECMYYLARCRILWNVMLSCKNNACAGYIVYINYTLQLRYLSRCIIIIIIIMRPYTIIMQSIIIQL